MLKPVDIAVNDIFTIESLDDVGEVVAPLSDDEVYTLALETIDLLDSYDNDKSNYFSFEDLMGLKFDLLITLSCRDYSVQEFMKGD